MRKFLAIIFLSISFIIPSLADDVRDFQIEGIKTFDKDFDQCLKLKDNIVKDILKDLGNPKVLSDEGKHVYDSTGKSKYYRTNIMLNPKAKYYNLSVSCTDWSKELEAKFSDKLKVSISNNEFNNYIINEAY